MYLICGILCIAAGIAVFAFPMESYMTLGALFGVLMLIVGAVQLIVASTSGNYLAGRAYLIVGGILDLILGILLCANPAVTLAIMPILLGIWLLYHSFMIIAFGGDMRAFRVSGGGWTIIGGIMLMLLSIIILVNPFSAGLAVVVTITGCGLIMFGIMLCSLSMQMKDLHLKIDPDFQ